MKFNININQLALINAFPPGKVDIIDGAIINFIETFSHSDQIEKIIVRGVSYFWIKYSYLLQEMPLIKPLIGTSDGIYRRVKKMSKLGLFEFCPDNKTRGRSYLRFGPVYSSLIRSEGGPNLRTGIRTPSDDAPNLPSDGNPKDNNTNINPFTKNKNEGSVFKKMYSEEKEKFKEDFSGILLLLPNPPKDKTVESWFEKYGEENVRRKLKEAERHFRNETKRKNVRDLSRTLANFLRSDHFGKYEEEFASAFVEIYERRNSVPYTLNRRKTSKDRNALSQIKEQLREIGFSDEVLVEKFRYLLENAPEFYRNKSLAAFSDNFATIVSEVTNKDKKQAENDPKTSGNQRKQPKNAKSRLSKVNLNFLRK